MTGIAPSVLDALMHPEDTAAGLAAGTPQAVLVPALDALTPSMLSVDGRIDALVAVERHIALLQARSVELLAALDAADRTGDGFTRDHVAAAVRVPPASMRTRMTIATELTGRLPATLGMLRAGLISLRHAHDLAEGTRTLTPESAAAVEARVLGRAAEQTATQFRAAVTRAVLRVSDPGEQEQSHTDAVTERRVVAVPADRGMTWLTAYLPAPDAATILAAINAAAHATVHRRGGDTRTADQRRADALVDLCSTPLHGPTTPHDPDTPHGPHGPTTLHGPGRGPGGPHTPHTPHGTRAHGQRPAIQVTVAASTLLGLDDQPAELDGHGPITAGMARRIAADPTGTWRRLLTDDHGLILAAGARTYRPPTELARTVIARDVHCQYPGCRRAARYTDLDHVRPYRPGDTTTTANLMSLCRRHHRLKHTSRWKVTRDDPTGITTWTDHHDRTYRSRPPDQPTTTTATPPEPPEEQTVPRTAVADPDPPPF